MKMIHRILMLPLLLLFLPSFSGKDISEELYQNFATAIRNKDSFQHYLVVRILDGNSKEVREFCTLGVFFRYALHLEWNLDFDQLSDDVVVGKACLNRPRLFEFKNPEAIKYLAMDLYTMEDLTALEKAVNFKKIAKEIRETQTYVRDFGKDEKLARLYAHALFNQGIMLSEDIGGESGRLVYKP